jgi:hypothetical protein
MATRYPKIAVAERANTPPRNMCKSIGMAPSRQRIELAPGETSLNFLQRIYRSPRQPIARRMRAAMAALQHEHPKLTAMAVNGETFAAMLDRAIARSQAPLKQIEHDPKETAEGITWTGPLRDGG